MTKPVCTVMVGLPATGKSYLVGNLRTERTWVYSTDDYIEDIAEEKGITYNEAFADNIKAATEFCDKRLQLMIELRNDVIWDQTNLSVKKRKMIIDKMKAADYVVNCICIFSPKSGSMEDFQLWKDRLYSRPGRKIPMHVIDGMMKSFTLPFVEEGFDKVTYIDMYGMEVGEEVDVQL